MYDHALWRAKSHLQANDIAFVPGLNEDLAATAVWGSQQVGLYPGAKVDGVFGIWYGKGPGVDRSMDPLKHANSAGTSRHGGVLALAGDDHGCQSSTLAHQSEQVFAAAMMPVLNPATLQDYLDLGILGFALSRYSGCWVGFKAISETVESSASIFGDPSRIEIVTPDDFAPPPDGLWMRWPDPPLAQERRLHGPKMQAVAAFARANKLDRIVLDSRPARLGILATGKAYLDLRQALADLGITDDVARQLGLRIYKVALTWPLEEAGARRFAEGLEDVLVVEEKRGFVEDQLVRILYNLDASKRPTVVGKRDETGAAAAAERRRADADDRGGRGDRAAAPPRPRRPCARAAAGAPGAARALRRRDDGQAAAHALFLLRMPAQFVDENPRRQPRHGRHRLPRHGAVHPEPPHDDHLAYGRRGRRLDRASPLHQRAACLSEHGGRHLHPFGTVGAARRSGRGRQHHLQDSL